MNEKTDDEDIRPQGSEREPAGLQEVAPAVEEDTTPEAEAAPEAQEPAEEEQEGRREAREAPPPPARRGLAGVLSALALLVALAAAALVGYLAWSGRGEEDAAASNREAIDAVSAEVADVRSTMEEIDGRIDELDSANDEQSDRLGELSERLSEFTERHETIPERLASLESTVSSLAGISTGARETWLLAEAEYYMQIANAQLQLAGNPERALLALRFADQRIRQVADPALTEVRRALADELRALRAVETPDLAGVTMTLASLADSVESLPLQQDVQEEEMDSAAPDSDAGGLDRAIASVKSAFGDIISVRRTDESVEPLLSPQAEYFLRANLALRLQTARLALLRGEQSVALQTLSDAAQWLRRYYVVDSRPVQSALQTLAQIRQADWSVTPPDISDSLRLLREYRERRRSETIGPETAPEPEAAGDEPAQ